MVWQAVVESTLAMHRSALALHVFCEWLDWRAGGGPLQRSDGTLSDSPRVSSHDPWWGARAATAAGQILVPGGFAVDANRGYKVLAMVYGSQGVK